MGYNAVTSAVGAVTGGGQPAQSASTIDTTNSAPQVQQGSTNLPRPNRGNAGTRIRTIHDVAEAGNTRNRFYNGNQVSWHGLAQVC